MARARGSKRPGMTPDQLKEGCRKLQAAYDFLTEVGHAYPISFDPAEPAGAANEAHKALTAVGEALTGDPQLFISQRLDPRPPFHRR